MRTGHSVGDTGRESCDYDAHDHRADGFGDADAVAAFAAQRIRLRCVASVGIRNSACGSGRIEETKPRLLGAGRLAVAVVASAVRVRRRQHRSANGVHSYRDSDFGCNSTHDASRGDSAVDAIFLLAFGRSTRSLCSVWKLRLAKKANACDSVSSIGLTPTKPSKYPVVDGAFSEQLPSQCLVNAVAQELKF
jgi:hypothetical protein